MGLFTSLDKKLRLRWKMTIPLLIVLIVGITLTCLITGYSLYYINLYQAKNKTLPTYAKAIKESLVKDMVNPNYKEIRNYYLQTLGTVKILRTAKVDQQFGKERENFYTTDKDESEVLASGKERIIKTEKTIKGIYPLKADRRCLTCHKVGEGEVLGGLVVEVFYGDLFSIITKTQILYVILGLFGILGGFLSVYIAYIVSHKPIDRLSKLLERMADGDLTIKVPYLDYKDITGRVARSINKLLSSFIDLNEKSLIYSQRLAESVDENFKYSEKMGKDSKELSAQASQIASAIEEMTATIGDIAKNATSVSDLAGKNIEAALEGKKLSEEAGLTINKANEDTKILKEVIDSLNKRAEEIGYIVQLIKDIADQTNLLALNATIEAARAGEHGRGFAVVADEIRKLADRTLKATQEISERITSIQNETHRAFETMEITAQEVEKALIGLNRVREALNHIVDSSHKVRDSVSQIAAATEQQSIASEEISKNVETVAKISVELDNLIENLGKSIYSLVVISSDLRHTATSVTTLKLKEELFKLFKADHERMLLRIKAHVKGWDTLNPEIIGDYTGCGIGKWFYGEEAARFRNLPVFKEFEVAHKNCHLLAREVILAYNTKQFDKVNTLLSEIETSSQRLLSLLEKMEEVYLAEIRREIAG